MADIKQVRARLATAHTATEKAASLLHTLEFSEGSSELSYMQRELHKILGRLEALDAGLAHAAPDRRTRSIIEAEDKT